MSIQELILIQAAWECHATPLITLPVKETTGALPPRWLIEYHAYMSRLSLLVHRNQSQRQKKNCRTLSSDTGLRAELFGE